MKKSVSLKNCKLIFFISAYHHITSITMKTIKEGEGVIISCFILVCSPNYVRCIATEVYIFRACIFYSSSAAV